MVPAIHVLSYQLRSPKYVDREVDDSISLFLLLFFRLVSTSFIAGGNKWEQVGNQGVAD